MAAKYFYFNLNYLCNNACIFCASGLVSDAPAEMSYNKVATALKSLKPGDEVMLNGGEPTLHKKLPDIVQLVKKAKAFAVLYTNGRKFGSINYARQIVPKMSGKVSIPLYGMTAKMHDYFTGMKGSFSETWNGVKNIIKLRKALNLNLDLEIKLLYIKPLLRINPGLIKFLLAEIHPYNFFISLNSLLISKIVKKREEEFVPDLNELKESVCKTLQAIPAQLYRRIYINLPFCIVPNKFSFLIDRKRNIYEGRYYDASHEDGCKMPPILPNTSKKFGPQCKKCKLNYSCNYSSVNFKCYA